MKSTIPLSGSGAVVVVVGVSSVAPTGTRSVDRVAGVSVLEPAFNNELIPLNARNGSATSSVVNIP